MLPLKHGMHLSYVTVYTQDVNNTIPNLLYLSSIRRYVVFQCDVLIRCFTFCLCYFLIPGALLRKGTLHILFLWEYPHCVKKIVQEKCNVTSGRSHVNTITIRFLVQCTRRLNITIEMYTTGGVFEFRFVVYSRSTATVRKGTFPFRSGRQQSVNANTNCTIQCVIKQQLSCVVRCTTFNLLLSLVI